MTVALLVVSVNCRAGVLDGTNYKVNVTPNQANADKKQQAFDDKLSFAAGKFSSATFLTKGFKAAKYNGDIEPNEAEFEVEQTNDSGEVVNWLGEIRGKQCIGSMHWKKKDGPLLSYDFTGTKE